MDVRLVPIPTVDLEKHKRGVIEMDYRSFYLELIEKLEKEAAVTVSTKIAGEKKGRKYFGKGPGEEREYYTEALWGRSAEVILGGGHVSLALAKVLDCLGYYLIVVDDREEFANKERFYMADEVLCLDFETEFPVKAFPPLSSYIILTRGHKHDYTCLRNILNRSYAYLGMIGSRNKVKLSFDKLRAEGFKEEQIASVNAPVGLPIGGETPAEIAVSITAQMIEKKNKKPRFVLEESIIEGIREQKEEAVLVSIIRKSGSSPRGKGSRMLVTEAGKIWGTIGGGSIEHSAIKKGQELCGKEGFWTADYDLSDSDAANLGMVCGGDVSVMFEPLEIK